MEKLYDNKNYRQWLERFKNAVEQARPGGSRVLTFLSQLKDKDVSVMQTSLIQQGKQGVTAEFAIRAMLHHKQADVSKCEQRFHDMDGLLEQLNRELWIVLVQKTEKEAYEKANSAEAGEGLFAFVRINDWFSKTTELGKTNRVIAL